MDKKNIGKGIGFIIAALGLVGMMGMVAASPSCDGVCTSGTSVVGTVTLPPPIVCTISVAGALNYGTAPRGGGMLLASNPIVVSNTGNTGGLVSVYGTDWNGNSGSVGWTVYSSGATFSSPGTALTNSAVSTGVTVPASGSQQYSFGLNVPASATGTTLSQTVTFTTNC